MKQERINGIKVPYELSVAELAEMCNSGKMPDFVVAAEALGAKESVDSFQILRAYLTDQDYYKRLCALKVIASTKYCSEIAKEIEDALSSSKELSCRTALNIVAKQPVTVSEERIKTALMKCISPDNAHICYAANKLSINNENYDFLLKLFQKSSSCLAQEILSEILYHRYCKHHEKELFDLFAGSGYGKIRCLAVDIGKENGFDISRFKNDCDGHVRDRLK